MEACGITIMSGMLFLFTSKIFLYKAFHIVLVKLVMEFAEEGIFVLFLFGL